MGTLPDFSAVRAIFLDLDDTLCAYWDASKAGLALTFQNVPVPGHSPEAMLQHWAAAFREFSPLLKKDSPVYERYLDNGEPTRTEQMRRTLARVGIEDEALAQALSESYMVERDRALKLFPEATEFLEAVQGRYPLGMITNGPADIQRQEVATLGLAPYFDHIMIEGEMREGKPLLSVFRRAEGYVGLSPEQILFVGNSYHHDIVPAVAAGWRTAWVRRPSDVPPSATPERGKPESRPDDGPVPDMEIGNLLELLPLLAA